MIRITPLLFFIFFYVTTANAGNDNLPGGGRAAAMGGTGVAVQDIWSAVNNQSGLAFLENISVGVFSEQRFLLEELGNRGIAIAVPVKKIGVFSVQHSQFGYSLYRESKTGLTFSRKFGDKFSAAMQIDYLSTMIGEGYGNKNSFAVEAGVTAKLTEELTIGSHIYNPTRNSLAEFEDERIPTIIRFGLSYIFSKQLMVTVESEKDIEEDNTIRAGLEYKVVEQLYLRGGIATNPTYGTFGVGWNLKDFQLDIAAGFHQTLGVTPSASINYTFR